LSALQGAGIDPAHFKAEQLYPFDQFHGRNLDATRDHVALLKIGASDTVLDIGSGLGGPARYIAATHGAKVTGIDLTPEFVATARTLSERCGLSGQVAFQEGDALAMPFASGTFNAALCLYVAMNIENKTKLAAEMFRVLQPGGRLVWSQVVLGDGGTPEFPLPWAREAAFSFLTTPQVLRKAVKDSGLTIVEWVDERPIILAAIQHQQAAPPPPPAAIAIRDMLLGSDFSVRLKNFGRNMAEGRIGSIVLVAEKPR
jgi:SAM-dependent methyltransferase